MPESTPSPVLSALLALLGRSDQPLGAGAAREALTVQGFEVSEARILEAAEHALHNLVNHFLFHSHFSFG